MYNFAPLGNSPWYVSPKNGLKGLSCDIGIYIPEKANVIHSLNLSYGSIFGSLAGIKNLFA